MYPESILHKQYKIIPIYINQKIDKKLHIKYKIFEGYGGHHNIIIIVLCQPNIWEERPFRYLNKSYFEVYNISIRRINNKINEFKNKI